MKTRGELKQEARDLLAGNWGKAIGLNILPILSILFVGLVSTIVLGAVVWLFNSNGMDSGSITETVNNNSSSNSSDIIITLISSFIAVGISYTTLDWLRTKDADFSVGRGMLSVFSREYFVPVLVLYILLAIFTFLWTLLLVIPGIIKGYAYSQTYYIYKDINAQEKNTSLRYTDYITLSRELMNGHKFEYFVLQLSFIGWWILVALTAGIASFWVLPYYQTTMTAYYKDLAGDKFLNY